MLEKGKKKWVKLILVVYFVWPNLSKVLFQHVISLKIISELFYVLDLVPSLENLVCIFHLHPF